MNREPVGRTFYGRSRFMLPEEDDDEEYYGPFFGIAPRWTLADEVRWLYSNISKAKPRIPVEDKDSMKDSG